MRAVLTNLGSMGNVQPMIALAHELRASGHDPILVLAPAFASYVRQLGVEFSPLGWDLDYVALQRKDTADTLNGNDPINLLQDSLLKLSAMLPQMLDELHLACRGADVLISGHVQPASRMIHELTGIPFVSVHTNNFGGRQPYAYRQAAAATVNPFRAQYGLPPIDDPVHLDANSPQLALYAISRYLRPASADWPPHYHVTGFFFMEEIEHVPDPALEEFLEAGERPVVITFSSIAHPDPEATTKLLLEAIARVGRRAVIQHGWSGLAKGRKLPQGVLGTGFIQHTWLFPRSACIVHAGGSGSTATALRAGMPAVVVPHIGDQPLWAELASGLGCTGGVIPYAELTSDKLASAIQKALGDQALRTRASEMAEKIRAEEGVSRARFLIEQFVDHCTHVSSRGLGGNSGAAARKTLQKRLRAKRDLQRARQ